MHRLVCFLAAVAIPLLTITAAEGPKRDVVVVDEKTEATIRGALRWLTSKQMANGAWGSTGEEQRYVAAMTGYTLMAFQAAGQLPGEGEFGRQVSLGMGCVRAVRRYRPWPP